MKRPLETARRRALAAFASGALAAYLRVRTLLLWGTLVDQYLFKWLYRATGLIGPWMVGGSDILLGLASGVAFALVALALFRDMRWRAALAFLGAFWFAQLGLGFPQVPFVMTYGPLWLFTAVFTLVTSIGGRSVAASRRSAVDVA